MLKKEAVSSDVITGQQTSSDVNHHASDVNPFKVFSNDTWDQSVLINRNRQAEQP